MKKAPILPTIGFLSIIFALGHLVALRLSLYWTIPHADTLMHVLGGIIGSLLTLYVLQRIGISPQVLHQKLFLMVFVALSVFAVGVVWELWEIFVQFSDPFTDMWDTIGDLVADIVGAIIGFIYYEKRFKTKDK